MLKYIQNINARSYVMTLVWYCLGLIFYLLVVGSDTAESHPLSYIAWHVLFFNTYYFVILNWLLKK